MADDSSIDTTNLEYASAELPIYVVEAAAAGDAWLLTCQLPGSSVTHTVRSIQDPQWVTREMRTIVAAQLGVADDSFSLRLHAAH